jgi:hypothetical protein
MNLVSADFLMNALHGVSKLATSNCMYSVQKFSRVTKVTKRVIWKMGIVAAPGTLSWKGSRLKRSANLESLNWSKVFKNRMFR